MTRNKYLSFLSKLSDSRSTIMGIAILWIMLFHSGLAAPQNVFRRAVWYVFVSFGGGVGVNLFFILSGFGLYYSVSKYSDSDEINWPAWFKRRIVRLFPSYLIVSVVYYLLKGSLSLYNLLQLNFWIDGVRDFWFIPAILTCYVLFPPILLCARKWDWGTITVILLVLLIIGNFLFEAFSPYYSKLEIFTWRLPCFIIGVYLGYLSKQNPHINQIVFYLSLTTVLIVSYLLTGLSRLTFLILTVCLLPMLTEFAHLFRSTPIQRIISYTGTRSLQFYLIHVSIVPLVLAMVWRFNLILYFVLTFILGEILYQLASLFVVKPLKTNKLL